MGLLIIIVTAVAAAAAWIVLFLIDKKYNIDSEKAERKKSDGT